MTELGGKVALVTGASAGIGAVIAATLVKAGMQVIGLGRRKELLEHLSENLKAEIGKFYPYVADITKEENVVEAFKWTIENIGPVHVVVNNAGVGFNTTLADGETSKWRTVLETNVLAAAVVAREAISIMKTHNVDGHIVNINSIAGHKIIPHVLLNIYTASKYALRAMTDTLRLELVQSGKKIKVTSISPGYVRTEIFKTAGYDVDSAFDFPFTPLEPEDVADAVLYTISVPSHVAVTELTLLPVGQIV